MSRNNVELLKKLKALAKDGVGGEQENARKLLDELIKKYGIDEHELDDEIIETHFFRYKTEEERMLIGQVLAHTNILKRRRCYTYTKSREKKVYTDCTAAEWAQAAVEYDFYRAAWKEEVSFFFEAFVQKHKIVDLSPGHETDSSLSDDEWLRMTRLMDGMKDRELQPRLEAGRG